MNRLKEHCQRFKLALIFAFIVFFILFNTMLLVFIGMVILHHFGFVPNNEKARMPLFCFQSLVYALELFLRL